LSSSEIIIGSRGSKLALWQANYIQNQLKNNGIISTIKVIKTKGDVIKNLSFDKIEGKGFFTKEIENELLNKSVDIAVHSLKDLETNQPNGLKIVAIPLRENPSDTLLIKKKYIDSSKPLELVSNAIVGTSSSRRKNQLLFFRKDLVIKDLRGNVPTRIEKLKKGKYHAIVLAKAGLNRLNIDLSDFFVKDLSPSVFIPAPAQGALGIQVRENDHNLIKKLSFLTNQNTFQNVSFERQILNNIGGGCQSPFGAYSKIDSSGRRITWVTYASNVEKTPFRFVTGSLNPTEIVNQIKKKIEIKSVWISRELRENSLFKKLLSSVNFKIEDIPLIEKKIIKIKKVPECNWIFFNSTFAFDSIFHLKNQIAFKKIAAFGNSTADYLKKNGLKVDFIGKGSPNIVASDFSSTISHNEVVYFPSSEISIGSVQSKIPIENKVIETTYQTNLVNKKLNHYDFLVFTSPSNVEAFNLSNQINSQNIISIGPSTTKMLESIGAKKIHQVHESTELAIAETIFSLI
tara:strand:+ start:3709 stop:5256 length:1548 start_codon:yes stop_codon:yes gene_type:complete